MTLASTRRIRRQKLVKLLTYYNVTADDDYVNVDTNGDHAFVAVSSSTHDEGNSVWSFPILGNALEHLAGGVFDDWYPEALYNLDTGERLALHVANPVVSLSEDQGTLENPLEEPEPLSKFKLLERVNQLEAALEGIQEYVREFAAGIAAGKPMVRPRGPNSTIGQIEKMLVEAGFLVRD